MKKTLGFLVAAALLLAGSAFAQGGGRYFTLTNGAAGDTTAVGTADSSSVKDLQGLKVVGLAFRSFATGTSGQTVSRWAIQFRWHKNKGTDSLSVFPIPTTGHGGLVSATVDSVPTFGPAASTPSTVAPRGDEFVLITDRGASKHPGEWGQRLGTYVPIASIYGQPIEADALSVRWRQLSGPGVATTWIYLVCMPR